MGNEARQNVKDDAWLNAAKAIVAERLAEKLDVFLKSHTPLKYTNQNTRNALLASLSPEEFATLAETQAALTAWREITQ